MDTNGLVIPGGITFYLKRYLNSPGREEGKQNVVLM